MERNQISLFIMPGCQVCPNMEHLFQKLQREKVIDKLQVMDVTRHPELVEKYHIRSVPFYLINDVAFSGLKSEQEIVGLLQQDQRQNWVEKIREDLTAGELHAVEQGMRQHASARQAMIQLLRDDQTELVIRLGLTAVLETLASTGLFQADEQAFIDMTEHPDERIALDALYYLHLISTPASIQALQQIALHGRSSLRTEAEELLAENLSSQLSV